MPLRSYLCFDDVCFSRSLFPPQLTPPASEPRAAPRDARALAEETERIRTALLERQRCDQEALRTKALSSPKKDAPEQVCSHDAIETTPRKKTRGCVCDVCGLPVKEGAKRTFGRSKACNRHAKSCDGKCAERRAKRNGEATGEPEAATLPTPQTCKWCGKVIKEGSGWRKVCNGECRGKSNGRRYK